MRRAGASDQLAACESLAEAFPSNAAIVLLPTFSRMADAGMAVMDLVAAALVDKSSVPLGDVAKTAGAADACAELFDATRAWKAAADVELRHIDTAHAFAEAITSRRPSDCLRAVIGHHETRGGGLRWFALRDGHVEVRTEIRGTPSRYRFRLWPLCRLAAQCGVIRGIPGALTRDVEAVLEQDDEDVDE